MHARPWSPSVPPAQVRGLVSARRPLALAGRRAVARRLLGMPNRLEVNRSPALKRTAAQAAADGDSEAVEIAPADLDMAATGSNAAFAHAGAAGQLFPVDPAFAATTHCTAAQYAADYAASIADPEAFWGAKGKALQWVTPYTVVKQTDFSGDVSIRWFADGELNVCANCLDRHLPARANQAALIWEPDSPTEPSKTLTYGQLHAEVVRFAAALAGLGVSQGSRVVIYLPMIPEAAVAMLACARLGAVHCVVFGGFSPEALAGRIRDCGASVLITADEGLRGGKAVPLKANADAAITGGEGCPSVETVVVVRRTGAAVAMAPGRDRWYSDLMASATVQCPPVAMNAEAPLFILYTSGSTGKPKGALHTTGGYLLYASLTHKLAFDYQEGEVYWCTADVGWITGHSYLVYGPLANGATTVMFEGIPTYPTSSRMWEVVDKHKVAIFYTAPTLLRALMREGDAPVTRTSRASLRVLGTVGEPINPEAWLWYHRVVGNGRCPVVDTWWQTETGGFMLLPLPGAVAAKPGSAALPFFGVVPAIVDASNAVLEGEAEGALCILDSWPGQMRGVWGDGARFASTYFHAFPGRYFSGDGARRDAGGYYWITGRVDDVINVSGHRLGTAEVESALVATGHVAEAAVVGYPHDIKGQGIYAYVTLKDGLVPSDGLKKALVAGVRAAIGPIASPDHIQWAPGLPKTRSGKIMRRVLRKIAAGEADSLGDLSTLADPGVVADLIAGCAALLGPKA